MKKFLLCLMAIFSLTGCMNMEMGNTPSERVEDFFTKYQTLDKSVLDDLDNVLNFDATIDDNERDDYRDFMKKHYQDLKYEIKDETIDGNNATVEVEITVRDYGKALDQSNDYKNTDTDSKFEDEELLTFSQFRLEELKKVKDTAVYTLYFTLNKKDDKWVLNQPSNADLNKINGLYSG